MGRSDGELPFRFRAGGVGRLVNDVRKGALDSLNPTWQFPNSS